MKRLVIGTRKSQLAMAQTKLAVEALQNGVKNLECEISPIHTTGDKILDKPLISFGGKGIFIEEFESGLQKGELDIAVHSAKDMPAVLGKDLEIAATLIREDPRDVLVWRQGEVLADKESLVIGTGSKRRELQIKKLYDCECKLLRGNVNTRLSKLMQGEYDAIILAAAGLKRLGALDSEQYAFRFLDVSEMIPSGGQGIIALEAKQGTEAFTITQAICDADAYCRLIIERYILEQMKAGCHEPIGVYSELQKDKIVLYLMDGRAGKEKHFQKEIAFDWKREKQVIEDTESKVSCCKKILSEACQEIHEWLAEIGCV